MQHTTGGQRGSLYLTAWTDSKGDGLPDKSIGQKKKSVGKAGDWSEWEFSTTSSSIFVGYGWENLDTTVYYQSGGQPPEGYTGLGETVFVAGKRAGPPGRQLRPRFTNLQLRRVGMR